MAWLEYKSDLIIGFDTGSQDRPFGRRSYGSTNRWEPSASNVYFLFLTCNLHKKQGNLCFWDQSESQNIPCRYCAHKTESEAPWQLPGNLDIGECVPCHFYSWLRFVLASLWPPRWVQLITSDCLEPTSDHLQTSKFWFWEQPLFQPAVSQTAST